MLAELGFIGLFIAWLASGLGTFLAVLGAIRAQALLVRSGRNAFVFSLGLLTLVALVLIYAQYTGVYNIAYVSGVSKDAQPDMLKITALWGGQAGSLILWSWMLNAFLVAALWLNWKSEAQLIPWMMFAAGGTLFFFLLISNLYENPFERYWALEDGSVTTALLKPEGAIPAYPYQSDSIGEFFHTSTTGVFPNAPDARYDGRGLNPLLRHPGMVIHPPMLYLGFTGFIIPFAFAVASLMTKNIGVSWMRATRRWSLVAWMFLSLGLILGGRWAYDVLGWGGYWGWDPVENSSLMPWLTGTAFLHSVMIQERRGMLKGWNMFMIILTYLLVLFGTVATRTGLLSSVHSFAQSPLSVPMGLFLAFTIFACLGLYLWRGSQGMFRNDHALESMVSRESLFLFNNWIFLALTVVVFWGTWSELITGFIQDAGLMANTINLGPEYYEWIVPPLFAILFLLMGVAPLAAWRKATLEKLGTSARIPTALAAVLFGVFMLLDLGLGASFALALVSFAGLATLMELYKGAAARHRAHGENWALAVFTLFRRDQRRYGGYTIHLGVVIIGLGVIGSTAFQEVKQTTLGPNEVIEIGGYQVVYREAFQAEAIDGRAMFIANVDVWRDGELIETVRPRRDVFDSQTSPMTIAGVHSTARSDLYVLLIFWEGDQVTFRVYHNPLIALVWWGSLMLVIGTFIAVYPNQKPLAIVQMQSGPRMAAASAGD
jgi:cytochrome c-type biogenesis protein CcmF